jgi:beta-lactamase superfamily II metal-dependent hydrolase
MKRIGLLSAVFFLLATLVVASQPESGVYIRVVDVGAGLCCVAKLPDRHYMIYDGGNYVDKGKSAMNAIKEMIPEDATIDLLVLSHSDADHHGAVPAICDRNKITRVIRDGYPGASSTWKQSDKAIRDKAKEGGCQDLSLKEYDVKPGTQFQLGDTMVTFVCGFYDLPQDWPPLSKSEAINARSVVVRLDYSGRSVLFTGDTVGRHIGDPEETCIAAEQFMVSNASQVPIHSEVVVAPHHGGDNASSTAWVSTVAPEYVIFSAGHKYEHPREVTAKRYLAAGVPLNHIFRTDLGDNEGGEEWDYGTSKDGHEAGTGDVGVWIRPDGMLTVSYLVDKSIADKSWAAPVTQPPEAQPTAQPSTENECRPPAARWRPFRRHRCW